MNQQLLDIPSGIDSADKPRVCTVCDDAIGVLHVADALNDLPPHDRTDLGYFEAASMLADDLTGPSFDLLILAVGESVDGLPIMAQEVINAAIALPAVLVVIAPASAARGLKLPSSAIVIEPDAARTLAKLLPNRVMKLQGEAKWPGSKGDGPATALHDTSDRPARSKGKFLNKLKTIFRNDREDRDQHDQNSVLNKVLARRSGVIVFQGMSGGAGTTTLATNLAVELAGEKSVPGVCLLDLNLQFAAIASYLSIEETDQIGDAYQSIAALDNDSFEECLRNFGPKLRVFAGPREVLPVDALARGEGTKLINLTRQCAPLVIIDMPHVLTDWSEEIFNAADAVVCVAQQDVRSVRNARKVRDQLLESSVDIGHFVYALNRCPSDPDQEWWDKLKHFELGLGQKVSHLFPDGGSDVGIACDMGSPLLKLAPRNALRRSLQTQVDMSPAKDAAHV
ncbi:MAG: hypothetical protein RIE24_01390 [Silicimonas sp.]|uniref:AAA family ATPase n=1 Tax=Roseovarius sp. TaxID=1486281 RepID=UPI0032EB22A5